MTDYTDLIPGLSEVMGMLTFCGVLFTVGVVLLFILIALVALRIPREKEEQKDE